MDRDFAILLLNACYRASREMGEMGVMIEEFLPGEGGHKVKMEIGMAMPRSEESPNPSLERTPI